MEYQSVNKLLEKSFKENWNRPALSNYDGISLTYRDIAKRIALIHLGFEQCGLQRGDKVALCGNVHCAAMQTGTEAEVIASAEYCLTHAKPGGGYVYCTSNIPFKGLPLERYLLVLDVWKRMRDY